jgi:phosphoglycolate phosphatase
MNYRLLVFDWDGTIIDSASTIVDCICAAARDTGIEVPPRERAAHTIGLGLHDALRFAVPDLRPERYPDFVEHYRRHFRAREDSMQLFAGMRELLCELRKTRLLAVATGKSRRGLDRALEAGDLKGTFMASRCADETNPKPHPAMLLELMAQLKASREETLMIGDTSHDLEMARAAGVDALAVTYGAHTEVGLRACESLGCMENVQALEKWLNTHA